MIMHISSMLKDKLILLVDDEPAMLTATKVGLIDRGFTVQTIEGAEGAMSAIRRLKPSLIVSDLVMPGTNGFELFQQIRKDKDLGGVPVVFLTGVDDYHAKKFGKDLGSAAYLVKPADLDELEKVIKDAIGER
jgi:DNA-binding response OmpR family regulator